jgi:hypothetical protein
MPKKDDKLYAGIIFYGTTVYDFVMTTVLYVPIFISILSGRGAVFGLGLTMLIVNVVTQVSIVVNGITTYSIMDGMGVIPKRVLQAFYFVKMGLILLKFPFYAILDPYYAEILAMGLFYPVYIAFFVRNIVAPVW